MAFICRDKKKNSTFNYNIDWFILLKDLLPIIRRTPRVFSFLLIPFLYLNDLYLNFRAFRCKLLLEGAVWGQTIVLEEYLNMLYPSDGEITIENKSLNIDTMYVYRRNEDPEVGDETYIYLKGETLPPAPGVEQEYIFRKDEVELNTDFIVKIPSSIYNKTTIGGVNSVVNKYKVVGTIFQIQEKI